MKKRRRSLTGDVAVVVGAVVVLQEGDQSVQEVMRTQQNEFLQHICRNHNKEHESEEKRKPEHTGQSCPLISHLFLKRPVAVVLYLIPFKYCKYYTGL